MYEFNKRIVIDDNISATENHWLKITKEFYRWKKTPEFQKWKKKQFLKQGGLCWYCQVWLPMTKINVEHKLARSNGGRNNKNNLVLACSNCNKEKGSRRLSNKEKTRFNSLNKDHKGTYLKNKEYFSNLYGEYSDESIYSRLKEISE